MFMCVWYACIHGCMCVGTCSWRPTTDVRSLYHYLFWEAGALNMTSLASKLASGFPSLCSLLLLELWVARHDHLAFTWVLGICILLLVFARQTLGPLSLIPKPSTGSPCPAYHKESTLVPCSASSRPRNDRAMRSCTETSEL